MIQAAPTTMNTTLHPRRVLGTKDSEPLGQPGSVVSAIDAASNAAVQRRASVPPMDSMYELTPSTAREDEVRYPAAGVDAVDPVLEFQHDHEDLNLLVRDIGALVRSDALASELPSLAAQLVELREHLFLHFAREEEGLFPYVAGALPDLADDIAAMVNAHDTTCGAIARMVHVAQSGDAARLVGLFDRFELAYTVHARAERALLQGLGARLSPGQRAELILLLRGL